MPNLGKIRSADFHEKGTGSLVLDSARGLTSMIAGAGHKLLGGNYSKTKEKVSKGINKGLWHGIGKHVDYADRDLGRAASRIPILGRMFRTKDKYEAALTPEIQRKITLGHKLTEAERLSHQAATSGVNTHRLTAPIKSVAKVAVPVAASMYAGEKMMKHRENKLKEQQQQKSAELNVVVQKSMLLKTAGVLRNLDQEKKAALAELAETTKLATAQKAVLSLVKDGLIDLDDIDEKIAELVEHPDRADSFFSVPKSNNFGSLSKSQTSSSNLLEDFLLNGEK